MPLSARTVHDRTIMMANQVEEMQVKDIYAAPFFSLALDESTDFITHPNECSLNTADLSYIPGVSVRDFEAEVADLKASDMWVNKFKSLNEDLERIARQKAELASKHMWTEMKNLQPEDRDYQNLERASCHIPHTAAW
ncbi:hypothetical protein FQN60_013448 [Etheostoma spectabile]|uniref:Uncharacterized protein n=1 Tax=Etheostoma spectabile TaxID=54343 RepID=A0A5J5CJQ2_9PERO|nr:hypothetical protein FQN60_013448 [Etheostoma spectabile]